MGILLSSTNKRKRLHGSLFPWAGTFTAWTALLGLLLPIPGAAASTCQNSVATSFTAFMNDRGVNPDAPCPTQDRFDLSRNCSKAVEKLKTTWKRWEKERQRSCELEEKTNAIAAQNCTQNSCSAQASAVAGEAQQAIKEELRTVQELQGQTRDLRDYVLKIADGAVGIQEQASKEARDTPDSRDGGAATFFRTTGRGSLDHFQGQDLQTARHTVDQIRNRKTSDTTGIQAPLLLEPAKLALVTEDFEHKLEERQTKLQSTNIALAQQTNTNQANQNGLSGLSGISGLAAPLANLAGLAAQQRSAGSGSLGGDASTIVPPPASLSSLSGFDPSGGLPVDPGSETNPGISKAKTGISNKSGEAATLGAGSAGKGSVQPVPGLVKDNAASGSQTGTEKQEASSGSAPASGSYASSSGDLYGSSSSPAGRAPASSSSGGGSSSLGSSSAKGSLAHSEEGTSFGTGDFAAIASGMGSGGGGAGAGMGDSLLFPPPDSGQGVMPFSMAGSENDAAVKSMVGDLSEAIGLSDGQAAPAAAEVLAGDSQSLFLRVRESHQRALKRGDLIDHDKIRL